MSGAIVLVACLLGGYALRARVDPAALTIYLMNLALPALAVSALHDAPAPSVAAVAAVWAVFVAAAAIFVPLGRHLGWDRPTTGCVVLCAGLSNTSFVGFPLLEVLRGPDAVAAAVPLDQLGSFLLVCTLAPAVVAWASGRVWSARDAAVRIGAFPAFWAMVVAFVVPGDAWPTAVLEACDRLAQTLSPVALFAVGARLRLPEPGAAGPFWSGLGFKLVFAPLLALGWMGALDPDAGPALRDVVVLEAAMPPMVTGALLAQAAGLRAELAAAFLGVGVPVSLLTVPVWAALLRHVSG